MIDEKDNDILLKILIRLRDSVNLKTNNKINLADKDKLSLFIYHEMMEI